MGATYDVNNHGGGEDANGNPGYVPLPALGTSAPGTYDVENRLVALNPTSYNPVGFYSYDPANKRVWRGNWNNSGGWTRTADEITFWSVGGRKLASYALTCTSGTSSQPQFYATQTGTNYHFGGKLIKDKNGGCIPTS